MSRDRPWDTLSKKKPNNDPPKDTRLYTLDNLIDTLERVFGGDYTHDPNRMAKAKTLYKLAKEAHKGSGLKQSFIVELGAHQGFGTICLCYGAKDGEGTIVHTVDAYQNMLGWANEEYTEENRKIFFQNIAEAGVKPVLHQMEFVEFAESSDPLLGWNYPVSLLVWDGGNHYAEQEIGAWKRHICGGGVIAIHDTEDGKLGSDSLCERYIKMKMWGNFSRLPGGFRVIRRMYE